MFSISSRQKATAQTCGNRGGFTLVEMLVVLAIFVVITGIILANLPDFKSQINLDLIAQEVALRVRSAQVFAAGTKSPGVTNEEKIDYYGIHFGGSVANGAELASALILYGGDITKTGPGYLDGLCRRAEGNCLEIYKLPKGYVFESVCLGTTDCAGSGNSIDVYFRRPETEPHFLSGSDDEPGIGLPSAGQDRLLITIKAQKTQQKRYVRILSGGQISVSSVLP